MSNDVRFEVKENESGKYEVIDTTNGKPCAYTGRGTNPPRYRDECGKLATEWNNYTSARGFMIRLAVANGECSSKY